MFKLYGIPNCNTVKKAMLELEQNGHDYEFINFKKQPPTKAELKTWKKAFGDWPVNKKGPTYRKIKEEFEAADSEEKLEILINTTSAIKRPILVKDKKTLCFGFDEDVYQSL